MSPAVAWRKKASRETQAKMTRMVATSEKKAWELLFGAVPVLDNSLSALVVL